MLFPVVRIQNGQAVDFIIFGDAKSAHHFVRVNHLEGWRRVGDKGYSHDPHWGGSIASFTKNGDGQWNIEL